MTISVDEWVAALRNELGTPYRHQGRALGVGVDCAGLLVAVAAKLGVEVMDNTDYTRRPDPKMFMRHLLMHCDRVTLGEEQTGDVLMFSFDANPQHVAVLTDKEQSLMIHSYLPMRKVVEHRFDDAWLNRLAYIFRSKDIR